MNSSNPNTPPAESPKPYISKLAGMTMDQKADWFAEQAVIGLNRAAEKARANEAQNSVEVENRTRLELASRAKKQAKDAQNQAA